MSPTRASSARRRMDTSAPRRAPGQPVRIAWSADVCGQGWGIDRSRGGMRLFETMADANPDLFVHVGDTIYADGPLAAEVKLDDGTMWRNLVTPAKSKVAETLDEFRGNHLYNRLDEHYRRVCRAGRPGRDVGRPRGSRQLVSRAGAAGAIALYREARRRAGGAGAAGVPRALPRHDGSRPPTRRSIDRSRSARSSRCSRSTCAATAARTTRTRSRARRGHGHSRPPPGTVAGRCAERDPRATWKIVAADMPLGVIVAHQPGRHEAVANGDHGAPLGRELEIAEPAEHAQGAPGAQRGVDHR